MSKTESFEFLNELALAFRAAENHPRPQYAPVLEGIRAVLAHLQSTGRLIPAGGMALTAEEVEDVRTVLGKATTEYGAMELTAAWARLRALFPATEPAEEVTQAEGFCSFCGWSRDACTRGEGDCAPAVPAEEETKAEADGERDALAMWLTGYGIPDLMAEGIATALLHDYQLKGTASSPVVPAPTETGPWNDITKAPKHLTLTDRDGDVWEWDGDDWVTPETAILPTAYINKHYAPFVAAEEG